MRGNILHYSLDFSSITKINYRAAVTFGLESANVVGYQTKTVKAGFSLNAPTFLDVNSDGFDLSNFKLGETAAGDGTEQIQVLDENGQNNENWVWLNGNMGMEDGWYDAITWQPVTKKIVAGNGYLMNVAADVEMTVAGQVKDSITTITLNAGFTVAGNNSPVNFDIQNIKIIDGAGDGTEQIQVLDENGQNNENWVWLNGNMGMEDGWYDAVTWSPITYDVKPGEAFLINVVSEVQMTIPAAL